MNSNSSKITQAVILCAGLGTRLRPLTDTVPKPMIPLLGKPMLEWNIENLKSHGVAEFFINLHHLPEVVKNYFGDGSRFGIKINYSYEPEILGTAGGLKNFENLVGENFFLIYGDMLSLVDYSKMATAFFSKKDSIGMQRTKKTSDYADADVAELDSDMKFIKIHPKPHLESYPNAHRMRGVFIFRKEIFSLIPAKTFYEIGRQLLPGVVARGKNFYGYECEEYSKGIDTVDKYKEVESYLKNINLKEFIK
ncbi:MAG: nucleotidyltransferase family protein [Candidatus Paceibacterota bacterium]|jgi:NDP-sugar pyrophosphorylase family protein